MQLVVRARVVWCKAPPRWVTTLLPVTILLAWLFFFDTIAVLQATAAFSASSATPRHRPLLGAKLPAAQCMMHFANPLCLTIDIDVEHEYFLQEECHWSSAVGRLWVSYVQQTFNEDDVSRAPGSSKRQEYLGFGLRCGCVR